MISFSVTVRDIIYVKISFLTESSPLIQLLLSFDYNHFGTVSHLLLLSLFRLLDILQNKTVETVPVLIGLCVISRWITTLQLDVDIDVFQRVLPSEANLF